MKRATINDVASAAGVSGQTVSRALNDKGEIDSATKRRVLDATPLSTTSSRPAPARRHARPRQPRRPR
ncbi:LacI family DNA-binding transcriptional regulator [Lentzea sp. NPDC042327]|uniref:LacI family DNA-binding transcriptional regulator n=1 Tax=Lentzea sp. NPDC042327 TaxID=3154801 RepID=UPI003409470C